MLFSLHTPLECHGRMTLREAVKPQDNVESPEMSHLTVRAEETDAWTRGYHMSEKESVTLLNLSCAAWLGFNTKDVTRPK